MITVKKVIIIMMLLKCWCWCSLQTSWVDSVGSLVQERWFSFSVLNFCFKDNHVYLSGIQMQDLSTGWLHCDPGPLFSPEYFTLPGWIPSWVSKVVLLESDYYICMCVYFYRLGKCTCFSICFICVFFPTNHICWSGKNSPSSPSQVHHH